MTQANVFERSDLKVEPRAKRPSYSQLNRFNPIFKDFAPIHLYNTYGNRETIIGNFLKYQGIKDEPLRFEMVRVIKDELESLPKSSSISTIQIRARELSYAESQTLLTERGFAVTPTHEFAIFYKSGFATICSQEILIG